MMIFSISFVSLLLLENSAGVAGFSNPKNVFLSRHPEIASSTQVYVSYSTPTSPAGDETSTTATATATATATTAAPVVTPHRRYWRSLVWATLATATPLSLWMLNGAPSFAILLDHYRHWLTVRPLRTKVATGALLAVLGDALAQSKSPNNSPQAESAAGYDIFRAISFATFDSCYRVFQHGAFPLLVQKCRGKVLGNFMGAIFGSFFGSSDRLLRTCAAMEQTMA